MYEKMKENTRKIDDKKDKLSETNENTRKNSGNAQNLKKNNIFLSIKCLTSLKKHGKTWCGSNGT